MILLLFPLLLSFASAQFLNEHLRNYVNVQVEPCDDFFLHVCSQSVDPPMFPFPNNSKFYQDLMNRFSNISSSRNLPIINDIGKLREAEEDVKPALNRSEFKSLVRARCNNDTACYRDEFSFFYNVYNQEIRWLNERLDYFASKLNTTSGEDILNILPNMIEFFYLSTALNETKITRSQGIFEKVVNVEGDVKQFKELIINKFKITPWLNEEDHLGLTLLPQFEDTIKEMEIYYDLGESDRDLELLRSIISKFNQAYYRARERSTGNDVLDIFFSLHHAASSLNSNNAEEVMLISRVISALERNAFYLYGKNRVMVLAPYLYPEPTDNATLNKGSCNSGEQTFHEDGPDVEGMRVNYEFLTRNYNDDQLKEIVFTSDSLSVNREQAFFYLFGIEYCTIIEPLNHTDTHSLSRVRVNGVLTQLPEFTSAFSCSPEQAMYMEKEKTCNLFGPDSKGILE